MRRMSRRARPFAPALARAILAGAILAAAAAPALAGTPPTPERRTALGFMAGEPTGITLRVMGPVHWNHAWEMGLGWSMANENAMEFHAQHQWHLATLSDSVRGVGTFYIGAGGRVKQIDGTRFGARGAVGFLWFTPKSQRTHEAFFEIAPILDLTPDRDLSLSATVGMRWFLTIGAKP
jgi:hypothetical protein